MHFHFRVHQANEPHPPLTPVLNPSTRSTCQRLGLAIILQKHPCFERCKFGLLRFPSNFSLTPRPTLCVCFFFFVCVCVGPFQILLGQSWASHIGFQTATYRGPFRSSFSLAPDLPTRFKLPSARTVTAPPAICTESLVPDVCIRCGWRCQRVRGPGRCGGSSRSHGHMQLV